MFLTCCVILIRIWKVKSPANKNMREIYMLMAGGSGKRLWPASRLFHPKPLFRPDGEKSLICATMELVAACCGHSPEITVLVGASHEKAFRSHVNAINLGSARVGFAVEPLSRNTAPAIALGVMRVLREFEEDEDAVFAVCPSDHFIGDKDAFRSALKTAVEAAGEGMIAAIGIEPTGPETGYGYIQKGAPLKTDGELDGVFKIKRFAEKPDLSAARKYVADGFLWNCGIFVFKGRVMMEEIKKRAPDVFSAVRKSLSKENSANVADAESYARAPDISIDFAVMEKTDLGAVVPANFEWNDIGSWDAVRNAAKQKSADGNVVSGDVVLENSENCLVRGKKGLIVGNGLKNLAIVDEGDALLVSDIKKGSELKTIVDGLIRRKRTEAVRSARLEHGWGVEELMEKGSGFSVKNVKVFKKMEYEPETGAGRVIVLQGDAIATFGEKSTTLSAGDLLEIPGDIPVRIKNSGKTELRLLEVCFEKKN